MSEAEAHGETSHGHGLCLYRSEAGEVSICRCGVVTLTMQHLSLRLRPQDFRSLTLLLARAQSRLDQVVAPAPPEPELEAEPTRARNGLH